MSWTLTLASWNCSVSGQAWELASVVAIGDHRSNDLLPNEKEVVPSCCPTQSCCHPRESQARARCHPRKGQGRSRPPRRYLTRPRYRAWKSQLHCPRA
ncbi:hypothetical protein QBC37DRAFT_175826 [Rhypophila decipiens]|uniref:Secreted protein n=1 Tax=Rhypophila decipiens TaxID=261697 RepID=A0AAN7B7L5_9PEZI|nr:hypothetical protein QBC37DRAFT_175826 [Rhypophila decipiens]